MIVKLVTSLIAVVLVLLYLGPVAIKMKDPALWTIIVVGIATMLFDLWQSSRDGES